MGRSRIIPFEQPDDVTCGPVSLKFALEILGKRTSLSSLVALCKPTRYGTSTDRMIAVAKKLGLSVLTVERASLHHVQSALKTTPGRARAVLVDYLYELDARGRPHPESGHWAVVASYHASKSRIVLLDSAWGQKTSYQWSEFRSRWMDFDRKRVRRNGTRKYKVVRKWLRQLLVVVARDPAHLPKFRIATAKLYTQSASN